MKTITFYLYLGSTMIASSIQDYDDDTSEKEIESDFEAWKEEKRSEIWGEKE